MFLYRLALEVGEWDVEQTVHSLASRITVRQLATWEAYYRIEPFGQPWRIAGRHASAMAASWSGKWPDELEERFLPTYRPDRPQTEEEMRAELMKAPGFRKQLEQQGR